MNRGKREKKSDTERPLRTEMSQSHSFPPLLGSFSSPMIGSEGYQSVSGLLLGISASCFSVLTKYMCEEPAKMENPDVLGHL